MRVVPCGPERADEVHRLTQAAFAGYEALDPPSGALRESAQDVARDLAAGGGAIAELDGRPVACLRWQLVDGGRFHVRRVAVMPGLQRSGVGRALMHWAEREAARRGCTAVTAGVRVALVGNRDFFTKLGYAVTGERSHDGYTEPTWLALEKKLA